MASGVKEKIIDTAWKLFRRKGFSDTTINDIISEAGVSKGTFYYYFRSKDDLLDTLSVLFDRQYEILAQNDDGKDSVFDRLVYINSVVHTFINDNIDYGLMAYLYSSQIVKDDTFRLLDRNRFYFRYLERLIERGRESGELTDELSVSELVRYYSLCERALVTDWCMNNGNYHLGEYSSKLFPLMIAGMKNERK